MVQQRREAQLVQENEYISPDEEDGQEERDMQDEATEQVEYRDIVDQRWDNGQICDKRLKVIMLLILKGIKIKKT